MKALITGASSGIGRDMAYLLSKKGYELILASRNTKKLEAVQKRLPTQSRVISVDLSRTEDCYRLYEEVKGENIDLLINNAGFGAFGRSWETPLSTELNMIALNIQAVHILTKLFLADFKKRDRGRILNVASIAAFLPGPLMSTYYATKAYVLRYSLALAEELRQEGSNVQVAVLCPGPTKTGFDARANVVFRVKNKKSRIVAAYALRKLFAGKEVIIPGVSVQLGAFFTRFLPNALLMRIAYHIQKRKER